MKIALVILHADPARGGAERYTVDLAAALVQRGHEVHMLAQSFAELPANVKRVEMPSAMTRTMSYRRFLRGVDEQIDRENYDIVHAMLPVRRCHVYHPHAGMAAGAMRKPNWLFNPRRVAMARVERDLLASANAPTVLCLSEYVKRAVIKQCDIATVQLATLFNAVDLQKFDPASAPEARRGVRERFDIPDDAVVALIIAQDFERKGLREAIQATGKVADRRMVLLVVGKGKTEQYSDWAAHAGAADRVIFAGATDDPRSFYAAADFFVLPTRHDPCSLVVLESLAMGKPVISTVFNGACEIMQPGTHGFVLTDPTDVETLAGAMRQLLVEDRRTEMSRACLALRPQLSYETHVGKLLEIYANAKAR